MASQSDAVVERREARLVADGQKIEGNLPGPPFPIPQSGLEVLWNHMVRYAEPSSQEYDVYYVGSNGKPILSTTGYATVKEFQKAEVMVAPSLQTEGKQLQRSQGVGMG